MRRATREEFGLPAPSGEHETRLARNYLARQASQVVGVVVALGVTALLARRLSLSEFGTYALLLSLVAYLAVLQGVVESSAIKALAEASDQPTRDRAFSTVLLAYSVAGVVACMLVASFGWVLLGVWSIPASLRQDARFAVVALAVMMLVSWPLRVFYDTLRGNQLFGRAAAAEIAAVATSGGLVVAFVLDGAPLWLIVSAAASGSIVIGLSSGLILLFTTMPYRLTRVTRAEARAFLGLSAWFSLASCADFVIYSLDRTILGAFRPAAVVALYEGPVRGHNLVRDIQAAAVSPVLPAAARFQTEGDSWRLRDLMLRGTRYTLAIVIPPAIVLMVLARPILEAWLGKRFGASATAMTILVGYWVFYANTSVGWSLLVAVGQIRKFALYAAAVAIINAAFSLALTPSLGLNGVVLGTAIPYALAVPVFLRMVPAQFGVTMSQLAREAWLPAYSTAAVVAAGLVALRATVDLATLPACAAAGFCALLVYWGIYGAVWLRPEERVLARTVLKGFVRH